MDHRRQLAPPSTQLGRRHPRHRRLHRRRPPHLTQRPTPRLVGSRLLVVLVNERLGLKTTRVTSSMPTFTIQTSTVSPRTSTAGRTLRALSHSIQSGRRHAYLSSSAIARPA